MIATPRNDHAQPQINSNENVMMNCLLLSACRASLTRIGLRYSLATAIQASARFQKREMTPAELTTMASARALAALAPKGEAGSAGAGATASVDSLAGALGNGVP